MQQYFTEQAENYEEAYRKVREKYGDGATILLRKTVMIRGGFLRLFLREGVEVSGPIPQMRQQQLQPQLQPMVNAAGSFQAAGSGFPVQDYKTARTPSREPLDFDARKAKVLAAAGQHTAGGQKDPTIAMVFNEIRTIREQMSNQQKEHEIHPSLDRLDEILVQNDFPASYRTNILNRVKKEFPLDTLGDFDTVQDKVLEWIGESIAVYREEKFQRRPRIMILVGPTGVGKTTTIAKLAANFGIDSNGHKIREVVLITIDTFRIGARQQLEAYGKILQSPCYAVDEYSELKKTIAVHSGDADIILIDTFGKSPRDLEKLGQMKNLLNAVGDAAKAEGSVEVHLTVSAATKSSDLEEILQQFEPFSYRSVIITKTDETVRFGNIIGVLAEKGKTISYITNGQRVPADIKKASVIDLLMNLEGFKINRNKLEERFPEHNSEQFRKWS